MKERLKEWVLLEMREHKLEKMLDLLCKETESNLFVILPKEKSERVPYLKKELNKLIDKF